MVPWFLIFFCFFIIVFQTRLKYNDRMRRKKKDVEQFIKEDIIANFSKSKPLDDDMIIKIDEQALPFSDLNGEQAADVEERIKKNLKRPIINTGINSNYEIKKRFGLDNLQVVIDGEENYNSLIGNLNEWAKHLLNLGNTIDAQKVLEIAILLGSDISETYILMHKIFKQDNIKPASLLEQVEKLPKTVKVRVIKAIEAEESL